jgi:hypothetical protein
LNCAWERKRRCEGEVKRKEGQKEEVLSGLDFVYRFYLQRKEDCTRTMYRHFANVIDNSFD